MGIFFGSKGERLPLEEEHLTNSVLLDVLDAAKTIQAEAGDVVLTNLRHDFHSIVDLLTSARILQASSLSDEISHPRPKTFDSFSIS